ncbi:hypothetical protein WN944_007097 [Citrus x changshan-huyou]|uniref:Uncharacterized protein n=1 Tax=Citrus x changshan-huyou TaxID=2935761 RepID=A0AAP0MMM3_9ROSI
MRSQGKRLKFQMNLCASIDGIFNNLSVPFNKVKAKSASYMAADLDWKDLWQPELAGRISMVNSPREVIGSVLKYRGASYNSNDIDSQVAGGKIAVQQNLALLANQVLLQK